MIISSCTTPSITHNGFVSPKIEDDPRTVIFGAVPNVPVTFCTVTPAAKLANLAAYLVSDYSAYINGEVVTIDGGEWLQGAGEFNMLEQIPQEMWDMLEMMIKAKKKS